MEIIKSISHLTITAIAFVLFGCATNNGYVKANLYHTKSVDYMIECGRAEISKYLKKNYWISTKNKQMILVGSGCLKSGKEGDWCDLFYRRKGYGFVKDSIVIDCRFFHAMILDKNGNYIANAEYGVLVKNPEKLTSYSFELKLIELAKKENYLSYIKIMNCHDHIIGYKKDTIDVYKRTGDDLTLVYSK